MSRKKYEPNTLGDLLASTRKQMNLNRAALLKRVRAHGGLPHGSTYTIKQWETAGRMPEVRALAPLAAALGLELETVQNAYAVTRITRETVRTMKALGRLPPAQ
jgi:transcriptional regulator with XRE-family HTH domain